MGVLNWFGVKFAAFNKTWDGWYWFAIMHYAGNCTWTTWWVQYQRDLEDWKALLAWICTTITSLGPSHPPSLSSLISNSCKHTAVWLKLIMVGPLLWDQLIEYKTIATYIPRGSRNVHAGDWAAITYLEEYQGNLPNLETSRSCKLSRKCLTYPSLFVVNFSLH
jgi:hypothetical protein